MPKLSPREAPPRVAQQRLRDEIPSAPRKERERPGAERRERNEIRRDKPRKSPDPRPSAKDEEPERDGAVIRESHRTLGGDGEGEARAGRDPPAGPRRRALGQPPLDGGQHRAARPREELGIDDKSQAGPKELDRRREKERTGHAGRGPAEAAAECEEGGQRRERGDELRKTKNADRLGSCEPACEGGGGIRERRLFDKRMAVERGNGPCARLRHLERDRGLPRLVGKERGLPDREADPARLEDHQHKQKGKPRRNAEGSCVPLAGVS